MPAADVPHPSEPSRPSRSWLDRLFRLPVMADEGVLPFEPDPPASRISIRSRHRVAVVDGTLDGATLDDLHHYVGRDLIVTVSTADGVRPGDIVVTRATSGASISALHAVGDVTVVSLLDRGFRHDARAVASVLDDGADACLEDPPSAELAAHLRAIARRHHPAGRGRTGAAA